MSKSLAISLHPLAAALTKAQTSTKSWLGHSKWIKHNTKQKVLFEYFDKLVEDCELIPEMKSIISPDEDVIDQFIVTGGKGKGKIVRTDREFFIGSFFEMFLKWVKPGEKSGMKFEGTYCKSSIMHGVSYANGIACLKTKSGDLAFLKIGTVKNSSELFETCVALCTLFAKKDAGEVELHFPFVKLRVEEKYKWMKGLDLDPDAKHSDHPGYKVQSAEAKNELDIDNEGARIKSSIKIGMITKGMSVKPKVVKIDKPFLFWVVRPGCSLPVFAAFCNKDVLIK